MTEIGAGISEPPHPAITESIENDRQRYVDHNIATTVLLSDSPPGSVDAVFFHGRSFFDAGKRDIFQVAVDYISQGRAQYILLADSEGERVGETIPQVAYPGKSLWTDRLVKMGMDRERIIYSPHLVPREHGFNTTTEAHAFLNTCIERGFKTGVVLTQPHQIVRAMLGAVKRIQEQELPVDLWTEAPRSVDWNKKVKGSQGMELKPRIYHIQDEIDRVFRYQAKGDIASFDELFDYLATRDDRQNSR